MSVHVFYPNICDKVEFTKEELEKLLKDVYNEGWAAGRAAYPWYINTTTPYYNGNWGTTITASKLSDPSVTATTTDNTLSITYQGGTNETSESN